MDSVLVFHVLLASASYLFAPIDAFNDNYEVYINTKQCVHKTDQKFLSIALDSSLIRYRWDHFNFSSEKLQNLAKGLAPAYLRIGGTDEDFLWFNPDETYRKNPSHDKRTDSQKMSRDPHINPNTMPRDQRMHPFTNFTMTTKDVDNLFTFAKESGLRIIFGLNVLLRDSKTHHWNSTNAEQFMKYITGRGFTCDWELGNEPFDIHGLINRTITGKELAFDFTILRKLLNAHPEYGQMLVGPDVSSPWRPPLRNKYLKEFLTNIDGSIDAMTYHQYYTNNQAKVSEFYNPDLLDDLITEMQQVQSIMRESGASSIDPWLGETSSAYGGGVPGVSDSYIAGFMWLDKLGVAARFKHNVVIRQTFYGGSYSLINLKTLDPFPDYWSAFLYKKLVGSRVLEVHDGISLGRTIRVYAHCTSEKSGYDAGSLVLIALNTQHNEIQLVLTNGLEKLPVHQYLLTPGENNNVTSQTVRLNGDLLQMVDDTFLPNVQPKIIIPPEIIKLPAVSYGFFVIPNVQAEACQTSCEKITLEKFAKV
ncbi:heparanase isoform X1 [Paramuricea clavata]|uniref:Heparanase isoform X1 n=1 Tax=Paramuricea clavata TaxID=317549 RepID=A0A7D9DQ61_PARCT|nr:heparanase isoform X1 [Paramuricea clavata]